MENKQNDEKFQTISEYMKNASEKINNIQDDNKVSEAVKKADAIVESKHKISLELFKLLNNTKKIKCNESKNYNLIMSVEDNKDHYDDYDEFKKYAKILAKEFVYCPEDIEEDINEFKIDYKEHCFNVPDSLIDQLYIRMYGLEWAFKRQMNSLQYQNEMKFYEDNNLENPFEIFHPLCLENNNTKSIGSITN